MAETTGRTNRNPRFCGRSNWIGRLLTVTVAALTLVVLGACQAPVDQKRGGLNEFCNGSNDQCRKGLVCEQGVCTSLNDAPDVCRSICNRFSECNAGVQQCYSSCLNTLQTWSRRATSFYVNCYGEVACSKIQSTEKPWNICYQKLELKEPRKARCDELEEASQTCLNDLSGDYSKNLSAFRDACHRKGRTVSEERWAETEECVTHISEDRIQCGEMLHCVNSRFPIPDKRKFPTSPTN